ncbi:DUF6520 family protein [Arenibacter aquaticus]|nr:DUF6520 family protein [Arenibacter aquaticus]
MKKLKLILPMLAFVFAIALSFAFVSTTSEDYYATGFIQIGTTWYEVDMDCSPGEELCKVTLEGDETETKYQVYDDENGNPLESTSPFPEEIPDPRLNP